MCGPGLGHSGHSPLSSPPPSACGVNGWTPPPTAYCLRGQRSPRESQSSTFPRLWPQGLYVGTARPGRPAGRSPRTPVPSSSAPALTPGGLCPCLPGHAWHRTTGPASQAKRETAWAGPPPRSASCPPVPHAAPKARLPLPTPPGGETRWQTLPAVSSHACFSVCDAGAVARGALLPHVRREPHLARPQPGPPLRGEHPPARQEAGEDVTITQDAEQDGPAGSRPERSPHQHRPSPVSRPGDPAPGGGQAE